MKKNFVTTDDLLTYYRNHPSVLRLREELKEKKCCRVHLQGLTGSSPAFVAAATHAVTPPESFPVFFVLNDKEEAAYFMNDIESLCPKQQIFFFPDSFKKNIRRQAFDSPDDATDNTQVLQRAEVLNALNKQQPAVRVVTWPEALAEKVVSRQNLQQNTIDIHAGEKLSLEFITGFLHEYDFEQTDFVYEAGHFAVRGGIVDIFSFANDLPYRIEFTGNEIASIRSVHPVSQLSVATHEHITIIPNVQKRLLKESRESLFDFIPSNSLFWLKDTASVSGLTAQLREKFPASFTPADTAPNPDDFFESPESIQQRITQFGIVEFGGRTAFDDTLLLPFSTSPQPSFNKKFDLLAENLYRNKQGGYENILFADTARQTERLYAIFEDLSKKEAWKKGEIPFISLQQSIHEGFIDRDLKIACYTDHQLFNRYHRFRLHEKFGKNEAITLKELHSLKPGDFIVHIDHGIGKYAGLEKIEVHGKHQEAIRLLYKDNDILYISIHSLHRIARYSGKEGTAPVLHKLGTGSWQTLKQKTKKKVKDIAKDLIALYAKRKAQPGFAFSPDTYLQAELEASFIYEDTPDQIKATRDVKKDMESSHPMDRLICGDVGFGKTEIAIRAAFKAVNDSKQVAVLVPTTILALQHYNTFSERLKDFPCRIDFINRFKSQQQQKESLRKLAEGQTDILIGTHRLISKDVRFKDLGLLIIDEEQKFGVTAKEKLKALRVNIDTLTLTATPIPRTLQFSLMGARDLSIISTPPPNRYPITTELHAFKEEIIKEAVLQEVERGGQVFFVHNRVNNIHDIAMLIQRLCPGVRVSVGHGQMDGEKLEDVLMEFISGESDVLVSTTIIESGLDIPNANTMIINQAQHFGLSDLHQMRGRVGRSNRKAYCYLLTPSPELLTPEARQRLKAIEEFSELGSGFNVAMRDLDIRGAGNLLGGEQSGFIAEIGFEMYHKILDEALEELRQEHPELDMATKENAVSSAFASDCLVDTDLEILIPDDYVTSITERLNLYKELDSIGNENDLTSFDTALTDRFGPIPNPTKELLNTVRLRWKARELGFEKIVLKHGKLTGYFVNNPASSFYRSELFGQILNYVKTHPIRCRMKEDKGKLSLSFPEIKSVNDARKVLDDLSAFSKIHVA